jgi:hypothetical protein
VTSTSTLFDQAQAAVRAEREKHLLPLRKLLVVADLDIDLVTADPDIAFEKIAEIDGIDDLALEQVTLWRFRRCLQMN